MLGEIQSCLISQLIYMSIKNFTKENHSLSIHIILNVLKDMQSNSNLCKYITYVSSPLYKSKSI